MKKKRVNLNNPYISSVLRALHPFKEKIEYKLQHRNGFNLLLPLAYFIIYLKRHILNTITSGTRYHAHRSTTSLSQLAKRPHFDELGEMSAYHKSRLSLSHIFTNHLSCHFILQTLSMKSGESEGETKNERKLFDDWWTSFGFHTHLSLSFEFYLISVLILSCHS